MKHCKTGRQFGRVRAQRKALLQSLLSSLLIHGRIETTEAKAKETKSAIDKIITKAKNAKNVKMEIVRKVEGSISKEAVQTLVQKIDLFDGRNSGYARVIKLAPRRSDSARMAIVELVDFKQKKQTKVATKKDTSVTETSSQQEVKHSEDDINIKDEKELGKKQEEKELIKK